MTQTNPQWLFDPRNNSYEVIGKFKKAIIKRRIHNEFGEDGYSYYLVDKDKPGMLISDFSSYYATPYAAHEAFKSDYPNLPAFDVITRPGLNQS